MWFTVVGMTVANGNDIARCFVLHWAQSEKPDGWYLGKRLISRFPGNLFDFLVLIFDLIRHKVDQLCLFLYRLLRKEDRLSLSSDLLYGKVHQLYRKGDQLRDKSDRLCNKSDRLCNKVYRLFRISDHLCCASDRLSHLYHLDRRERFCGCEIFSKAEDLSLRSR